jgi:hypothetical protein
VIRRAIILFVAFLILDLCGGRHAVGFLSGTVPEGHGVPLLGAAYLLAWFGAVIIVPILVIAAMFSAACGRIRTWSAGRRR